MKKFLIVGGAVVVLGVIGFFALNAYIYSEKQADLSVYTLGEYGYRCDEGTEFTLWPAGDMSSVRIVPATSVERIGETILSKVPGDAARYEGDGLILLGYGETIELSSSEFSATCSPIFSDDSAPFNWGDRGEGAGEEQNLVPIVSELILGGWRSADDAKFVRTFYAGGTSTDSYDGAAVSTDSWQVFTSGRPLPVPYPLEDGVAYLALVPRETDADPLVFKISRLTPETLELAYLDRGGVLVFTKVQ